MGVLRVSWVTWGRGHGVSHTQSTPSSLLSSGQSRVAGLLQATVPCDWVMGIVKTLSHYGEFRQWGGR